MITYWFLGKGQTKISIMPPSQSNITHQILSAFCSVADEAFLTKPVLSYKKEIRWSAATCRILPICLLHSKPGEDFPITVYLVRNKIHLLVNFLLVYLLAAWGIIVKRKVTGRTLSVLMNINGPEETHPQPPPTVLPMGVIWPQVWALPFKKRKSVRKRGILAWVFKPEVTFNFDGKYNWITCTEVFNCVQVKVSLQENKIIRRKKALDRLVFSQGVCKQADATSHTDWFLG